MRKTDAMVESFRARITSRTMRLVASLDSDSKVVPDFGLALAEFALLSYN